MAITNRIENIILAGSTAVITTALILVIVHFITIKPLERQIQKQNEVIIELAKIEKYHYEIRNDFDKLKPRNSQIIIDLDNKLDALQVHQDTTVVVSQVKKSWIKKIFSKKK